jgi:hypothetical protein
MGEKELKEKGFNVFGQMLKNMEGMSAEEATELLRSYQEKESEFYRKVTEEERK